MSIKRFYNRAIRRNLGFFAAWPPVTNKFRVGTFGLMRGGVFVDIGHITNDFGVSFETEQGSPSSYHYESEGVTKVRTQAGVVVPAFEAVDVDAKLDVGFSGDRSLKLDIQKMYSQEMTSPYEVARALGSHPDWKRRYRVIDKIFVAEHPAIYVAQTKETTISLSGKAKLLKQIDEGLIDIEAAVSVTSTSSNVWTLPANNGFSGVGGVHMHLFRVRGGSVAPILGEAKAEDDIIDGSEDWPTNDDDSDLDDLPPEVD